MRQVDRSHALKHDTKRAGLTIQQLKVTLLVDAKVNAILDLHVTTTRKHDTQISPSLIKRNPVNIGIPLGDKRYEDQKIRQLARQQEVRSLIKHREFTPLHRAWNARLDTDLYGQRSLSEPEDSDSSFSISFSQSRSFSPFALSYSAHAEKFVNINCSR